MFRGHVFTVVLCLFWYPAALGDSLPPTTVIPSIDQFIPVNSDENVTFTCSVVGGGDVSVIWAVNQSQIRRDEQFTSFASQGVYIDPDNTDANFSTISLSRLARSNHSLNQVQCLAIQGITTCPGATHHAITYDPPSMDPTNDNYALTLQPSLMLQWSRPLNVPSEVPISYTIESNATDGSGMNFRNITSETSFSVQFLENMVLATDSECVEFQFFVTPANDAGTGPLARVVDTVPISPDVRNVSQDLRVNGVDVLSRTAQIFFPPVNPCSENFALTNYTVNIDNAVHVILPPGNVSHGEPLTIGNLTQDSRYSLTITACNNVTCRTSDTRVINTTDVQAVSIVFFENRLFLQCSFADNSRARGCVFEFSLIGSNDNETSRFNVSREEGTMCTNAPNQRDAYGSVFVMDWEENGMVGSLPLDITDIDMGNVSSLAEYTDLTGCVEASDPTVVIIVCVFVAVIVAIITVVIVVILIMVYRKKKHASYSKTSESMAGGPPPPPPQPPKQFKRVFKGVVSDSGEEAPLLYQCVVETGECQDKIKDSLTSACDLGREREKDETEALPLLTTRHSLSHGIQTDKVGPVWLDCGDDKTLTLNVNWSFLVSSLPPDKIPKDKDFSKFMIKLQFDT